MIFAFAVSLLGFAFVIRISNHLIVRDLFTKNEMTKIGTAYFAFACAFVFIFPRTHVAIWFAIFIPLIFISVSVIFLLRQRARAFQRIFREVLSVMLLKMRAGRSFRQSLSEVTMETDPRWRAKLSEIASVVVFSQQKMRIADPFVQEIVRELSLVDRQPHAAARRLKVYRDKLRTEDEIRRKSGQILSRLRAQSLVMCGLYLAVLLFMIAKFGWHANSDLMMGSALLFSVG